MRNPPSKLPPWVHVGLTTAGLVLTGFSGYLGVMSGVSFCGPTTYGPACGVDNIGYVALLFIGVALYLWSDAFHVGTPLATTWLLTVIITSVQTGAWNAEFMIPALLLGTAALVFCVVSDIAYFRAGKRRTATAHRLAAREEADPHPPSSH